MLTLNSSVITLMFALCISIPRIVSTQTSSFFDNKAYEEDAPFINPPEAQLSTITLSNRDSDVASGIWHNLNIIFDTSLIVDASNSEIVKILQNIVFPQVKARLEPMIKVFGDGTIKLPQQLTCFENLTVPPEFIQGGKGDIFISVIIRDDSEKTYLASGGVCYFEEATGRPIAGLLIINKKYFAASYDGMIFWVDNFVHEIFHVLIYSRSTWERINLRKNGFFTQTIDDKSNNINLIQGERVLEFGRTHFGCNSYRGIVMEEGGTTGSSGTHLEKVFYGNEVLTARFTPVSILSQFSLSMMQDSGLYQVDFSYAEPLLWGFQRGCDFLNSNASTKNFPEFCTTQDAIGCTHDFISKSHCSSDKYTDGKFINEFYAFNSCRDNYGFIKNNDLEFNGANSRCFLTKDQNSVSAAGCFKASCSVDNNLTVAIAGTNYVCNKKGEALVVQGLTIYCPDPKDFCERSSLNKCQNDCSGNGKCLQNGTCACNFLYNGDACQYFKDCTGVESCDKLKINSLGIKISQTSFLPRLLAFTLLLAILI